MKHFYFLYKSYLLSLRPPKQMFSFSNFTMLRLTIFAMNNIGV